MAGDGILDWTRWKRRGIWIGLTVTAVGAIWACVTFGGVFGADSAARSRKEQAMGMAMTHRAVAARPPLDDEQPANVQTATFALG
jgi:hypothetical protein